MFYTGREELTLWVVYFQVEARSSAIKNLTQSKSYSNIYWRTVEVRKLLERKISMPANQPFDDLFVFWPRQNLGSKQDYTVRWRDEARRAHQSTRTTLAAHYPGKKQGGDLDRGWGYSILYRFGVHRQPRFAFTTHRILSQRRQVNDSCEYPVARFPSNSYAVFHVVSSTVAHSWRNCHYPPARVPSESYPILTPIELCPVSWDKLLWSHAVWIYLLPSLSVSSAWTGSPQLTVHTSVTSSNFGSGLFVGRLRLPS